MNATMQGNKQILAYFLKNLNFKKSENLNPLSKLEIMFFESLNILLSNRAVCRPSIKVNELNLKESQTANSKPFQGMNKSSLCSSTLNKN